MDKKDVVLSDAGIAFLKDDILRAILEVVSASVGVTPEEYLIRFETVLRYKPNLIFSIFE